MQFRTLKPQITWPFIDAKVPYKSFLKEFRGRITILETLPSAISRNFQAVIATVTVNVTQFNK